MPLYISLNKLRIYTIWTFYTKLCYLQNTFEQWYEGERLKLNFVRSTVDITNCVRITMYQRLKSLSTLFEGVFHLSIPENSDIHCTIIYQYYHISQSCHSCWLCFWSAHDACISNDHFYYHVNVTLFLGSCDFLGFCMLPWMVSFFE